MTWKASVLLLLFLSLPGSFTSGQPGVGNCPKVHLSAPQGYHFIPGVRSGIVYKTTGGRQLALDAYIQQGRTNTPGIVVIHGGNWTSGSRITHIGQLLEMLTRGGYNWFSIDYSLAPAAKFPAPLDDLRDAVRFIRCNSSYFKTDPKRLALMGDDCGGQLAALLAAEKPEGVQAVVTFGAPLNPLSSERFKKEGGGTPLEQVFGVRTLGEKSRTALSQASPVDNLKAGMPAILLVQGMQDREAPPDQADRYCSLSRQVGNECRILKVEGGIHFIENWRPDLWGYKQVVITWLSDRLHFSGKPGLPYAGRIQKDVAYSSYLNKAGSRKPLLLDANRPEGSGPFPCVIVVHGGGWEAGDKVTYMTPALELLARSGFAWVSMDYRMTPEFGNQEQLDDVRTAIRFVRRNSGQFRIDPNRIALLGESASGQLVTQVASERCDGTAGAANPADDQSCRVRAVISFYGVYDFIPMVTDASPRSLAARLFGITEINENSMAILRRHSPLHQAAIGMPPVLLIHGTSERLWEQGKAYDRRLQDLGIPHELVALAGAPHGMENWEGNPQWSQYKEKLIDWLGRILKKDSGRREDK
jgi:acetyl esterase